MNHRLQRLVVLAVLLACSMASVAHAAVDTLRVQHDGLEEPVTIVKDAWGISHIYAQNEADLFFAQGYNAARDRLFQFEIWRRQATGTTAEILGPRAIERDIGTRLFTFRGDMTAEMNHYHPNGVAIITSYVHGVNAYIERVRANPDLLPMEFELLGIEPQPWTPEVVISRHQGLLGNIGSELNYGRAVARLGPETVKKLAGFQPENPKLELDASIDGSLLEADILGIYNAFRQSIDFRPNDLVAAHRGDEQAYQQIAAAAEMAAAGRRDREYEHIGSNNWVIAGRHTESGSPIMANDPHRRQSAPSLRYWVHLNAPGWNVIGGGEPVIPGVSIGHNGYGAWGLTVFRTDGEDLYVYETNPDDPSQYRYQGRWEDMRVLDETIQVKGQDPVQATLKYTRHGPVVYEDTENNVAYAVRAAWMEIGGAPYLASLRMNQATSWEEFRDACRYSHIPGENMIWADRDGTIGWQAVGIAPIRPNWSGLVPVPGDGRYEWDGYLPIQAKPHIVNPEKGFWGTANENLVPPDYEFPNAVGYEWSSPYRAHRIDEVLASGRKHSLMDMMQLQTDYLSIPARQLVPLLRELRAEDERTEQARQRLLQWDYRLTKESVAAGIYVAWERRLEANMDALFIPEEARDVLWGLSMPGIIERLITPPPAFGDDPMAGRDALVLRSLEEAVSELSDRLGPDMQAWHYGQENYKHALVRHPLSAAVDDAVREQLDVGPLPRGGNSYTVGNTGGGNNQTSGASFRIIVDTGDWDNTVGMNSPGQSGNPQSPFYDNLFELWAQDKFFPVYYSRDKIDAVAHDVILMEAGSE
jgi:penicillin amidase